MSNNNLPKITIVTPSYNQGAYIEEMFNSIYVQDYENIEHIVLDAGSNDNTLEIIKKYEDRIKYWRSEKDEGQTAALIEGFSMATGDILCWLNADDMFMPGALDAIIETFNYNKDIQVLYGDTVYRFEEDNRVKNIIKKEHRFSEFIFLYNSNNIPQPSTFWRREIYFEVGGLDNNFNLAMDGDLWIRFSKLTKIHHIPKILSVMRMHKNQKTQTLRIPALLENEIIRVRERPNETKIGWKIKGKIAKIYRIYLKLLAGAY